MRPFLLSIEHEKKEGKDMFSVLSRALKVETGQLSLVHQQIAAFTELENPMDHEIVTGSGITLGGEIKWMLESYTLYPDPAGDERAVRTDFCLRSWGRRAYNALFSEPNANNLYEEMMGYTPAGDIWLEIISADPVVLTWPWEAINHPSGIWAGKRMAIERRYVTGEKAEQVQIIRNSRPLNILLVSARQLQDVEYRLIGRKLLSANLPVKVTLLNPPTIANLQFVLNASPNHFDILHLDCHGDMLKSGPVIYLENENMQAVPVSFDILKGANVYWPALILLNACRSAMSKEQEGIAIPSLAANLLTLNGVNTVMAMAYKLPVHMVQQFFSSFYESLLRGDRCSVAAYYGRSVFLNWENQDLTRINFPHLDWMIPVVYTKAITNTENDNTLPVLPAKLAPRPDNGTDLNYTGRDEVIYLLDRLSVKKVVIHLSGVTGQGKSAAYREFFWWKAHTGESRRMVWIDFENIRSISAFQQVYAAGGDDILMVWDHADDVNIFSLPQDFQLFLLDLIQTYKGCILTAGRQERPFITMQAEVQLVKLAGLSRDETKLMANVRAGDPALSELLLYIAGHPVLIRETMRLIKNGKVPADLLALYRNNFPPLLAWFNDNADVIRLKEAIKCLNHPDIVAITPLLALFEEHAWEQRVIDIFQNAQQVESAYDILESNGLIARRAGFHPVLAGMLRSKNIVPGTALIKAFVQHWATIPDYNNPDPESRTIMIGTIQTAFQLSLKYRLTKEALALAEHLGAFYAEHRDQPKASQVIINLINYLAVSGERDMLIQTIAKGILVNRSILDVRMANDLGQMGEQELDKGTDGLQPDTVARFYYQYGKFRQETGNTTIGAELISKAVALLTDINDEELRLMILNETDQNIDELLADSNVPAYYKADIYRQQAERLMEKGEFETARRFLGTATIFANQASEKRMLAIVHSVAGELESLTGNLPKAFEKFGQSIELFQAQNDINNQGVVYHQLAQLHYRQINQHGEFEAVVENWINAASCFLRSGNDGMFEVIRKHMVSLANKCTQSGQIFITGQWGRAKLKETNFYS